MAGSGAAPNPKAVGEWLQRRVAVSGDRPAVTFDGVTWTFSEFQKRIVATANALHAQGVRKGARVGVLTLNRPDVLVVLFAAARLGAISVPVNFRLTAPELHYIIDDAGLSVLIVGPDYVPVIRQLSTKVSCRTFIQFDGNTDPEWPVFDAWIGQDNAPAPPVAIDGADVCTILYTSGTTGSPKGAMITHANVWANNLNWILAYGITQDDVQLSVAPMFHAGGLFANVLAVLQLGGHVVIQPQFDPRAFLDAIEKHKVTMAFGVPTMILALTQCDGFETLDLSTLRYFIAGGAPSPESLLKVCVRRGIPVSHAYGMTEATSVATLLETSLALAKVGSVGIPVVLGEMRLVDAEDREVTTPHVKAEVHVRGEHIFAGYWNKPEATAEAFVDGWFRSGDVAYLDDDGYLYVCDRVKDMIITGGENVYAAEVESVVLEHPAILNVAVVGAPDETWGEMVVAAIVVRPGTTIDVEELRDFCGPKLARYKLPRRIHLMNELPLNGAGKLLKAEIRRIVASELETA